MQIALIPIALIVMTSVLAADDAEPVPGLRAEYRDTGGRLARRVDTRLSFDWSERRPDTRLAPGAIDVRWTGYLESESPGEYQLFAFGVGRFEVRIDGQSVLKQTVSEPQWVDGQKIHLDYDQHAIEIVYHADKVPQGIAFFWTGPGFSLEPIDRRALSHDPDRESLDEFASGESLYRALRCSGCHQLDGSDPVFSAPALDQLTGHMSREWLVEWLGPAAAQKSRPIDSVDDDSPASDQADDDQDELDQDELDQDELDLLARRMPHFALNGSDAAAIADYLFGDQPSDPSSPAPVERSLAREQIEQGKQLFMSIGCLACHRIDGLGNTSLFDGGDLSTVALKRPARYFRSWLADPKSLNRDHRMPVFELSDEQRTHLAAYLTTRRGDRSPRRSREVSDEVADAASDEILGRDGERTVLERKARGRTLFNQLRCNACHRGPVRRVDAVEGSVMPRPIVLDPRSSWTRSCCDTPKPGVRPGYRLSDRQRDAVRTYAESIVDGAADDAPAPSGERLMTEYNCLGCHDRGSEQGLIALVGEVAEASTELRSVTDTLMPPSLNTVGDKLHDAALREAIARTGSARRPWLAVQMPRFSLSEQQLNSLTSYLQAVDRIPQRETPKNEAAPAAAVLRLSGSRLVTTDGFGCVSCHAMGSVRPHRPAPGTRGPALDGVSRLIRRSWFDRLLRHPARLVRRLEMPSIQTPVQGVLGGSLPAQLDALWHVLGEKDFEPPRPDPIRIIRQSGDLARSSRVSVLTDVLRTPSQTLTKPLLVGFGNRHNVVYDLASAAVVRWSVGDVAYQRTEGKTWYWEAVGEPLFEQTESEPEIELVEMDQASTLVRVGQFYTELDAWWHIPKGLCFEHRLHVSHESAVDQQGDVQQGREQTLFVRQRWVAWTDTDQNGWRRELAIDGLRAGQSLRIRVAPSATGQRKSDRGRAASRRDERPMEPEVRVVRPAGGAIDAAGYLVISRSATPTTDSSLPSSSSSSSSSPATATDETVSEIVQVELIYASSFPIDHYPAPLVTPNEEKIERLDGIPGFRMTRLPLDPRIMPTALAWRPDGTLVVASLKGRVWTVSDHDGDGVEDDLTLLSDELAAPYGLATGDGYVDVSNKYAVLRLFDQDGDGRAERTETIASGWGHTDDYHDWAVGLPRDAAGHYFVALPCQQDDRTSAAAFLRGQIIRLVPEPRTRVDPRRFRVETWAAGQRFPMGLALNRQGILVATDNQGNYNPFNELNHIIAGRHYGFINQSQRDEPDRPTLTSPAINIPHPWTRSVNGICFLELPQHDDDASDRAAFGPFAGQLVGCEYDTRRLIRMSLQEVDGQLQGATYPLSIESLGEGAAMLGPICCAVSPAGQLYVGSIRDSGWGGANDHGEVLQLQMVVDRLPCGIREVTARHDGLHIEFTRPVDVTLAQDPSRYAVSSYFRISTPAYGGDDQQRRGVSVQAVRVADNRQAVDLKLAPFVPDRVYEVRLQNLVHDKPFFPAIASYTLNVLPHQ